MYFSDVGYLMRKVPGLDAMRKPTTTFEERRVWCNKKGVKRQEFYQAQVAGYKPELTVEIKATEYAEETHFKFNGRVFRILRTYPVKNECLELVCTGLVAGDG